MSDSKSIFHPLPMTEISIETGCLYITQDDGSERDSICIPLRYVPEVLSEIKRLLGA